MRNISVNIGYNDLSKEIFSAALAHFSIFRHKRLHSSFIFLLFEKNTRAMITFCTCSGKLCCCDNSKPGYITKLSECWQREQRFVLNIPLLLYPKGCMCCNPSPAILLSNTRWNMLVLKLTNEKQSVTLLKWLFGVFKQIRCLDVTLKDTDVAKALAEYANYAAIEKLVLGASRSGLIR